MGHGAEAMTHAGYAVVLRAARCWDGLADGPVGGTEVLIRHGCVVEIGPRVDRTDAQVVELGDRTLLPGFIDCHVHTTFDPARGVYTPAVSDSAAQMVLNSLASLRVLLDHGFTTVRDVASFAADPITVYLRDAVEKNIVVGPRMVVAPHCISARGGHGDLSSLLGPQIRREIGALADGVDEITRIVREEIRAGADWVKFAATGGFFTVADDPGQVSYSQRKWTPWFLPHAISACGAPRMHTVMQGSPGRCALGCAASSMAAWPRRKRLR